ncbi:hypothetical protein TRVL_04658 [Trypanosoma vivax]|nr:hypothetical protein TRVL_04658 [Trypanosoma vivax]
MFQEGRVSISAVVKWNNMLGKDKVCGDEGSTLFCCAMSSQLVQLGRAGLLNLQRAHHSTHPLLGTATTSPQSLQLLECFTPLLISLLCTPLAAISSTKARSQLWKCCLFLPTFPPLLHTMDLASARTSGHQ